MTSELWLGLLTSVLLAAYLAYALTFPERP